MRRRQRTEDAFAEKLGNAIERPVGIGVVALRNRERLGHAVDRRRRCINDFFHTDVGAQLCQCEGPVHHRLERRPRLFHAMCDPQGRLMKDNVARADKFAHQGRVSNVALHESDVWPPECGGEIGAATAREIIDDIDAAAVFRRKKIHNMRSDEARTACYENSLAGNIRHSSVFQRTSAAKSDNPRGHTNRDREIRNVFRHERACADDDAPAYATSRKDHRTDPDIRAGTDGYRARQLIRRVDRELGRHAGVGGRQDLDARPDRGRFPQRQGAGIQKHLWTDPYPVSKATIAMKMALDHGSFADEHSVADRHALQMAKHRLWRDPDAVAEAAGERAPDDTAHHGIEASQAGGKPPIELGNLGGCHRGPKMGRQRKFVGGIRLDRQAGVNGRHDRRAIGIHLVGVVYQLASPDASMTFVNVAHPESKSQNDLRFSAARFRRALACRQFDRTALLPHRCGPAREGARLTTVAAALEVARIERQRNPGILIELAEPFPGRHSR